MLDRHEKIKKLLNDYPSEVGVGIHRVNSEVQKILNHTKMDISKMTPYECGEAAVLLTSESIYLQIEIGKMISEIDWCKRVINRLISEKIHEYGGQYTPYTYKAELAIKDNDTANTLSGIISNIELRLNVIKHLPNKLSELARNYSYLQKSKEQHSDFN